MKNIIKYHLLAVLIVIVAQFSWANDYVLIPMDKKQNNHLRAYGAAYEVLADNIPGKWILNYRGGTFLFPNTPSVVTAFVKKGASFETITSAEYLKIKQLSLTQNIMEVELTKAPKVAIYTPPNVSPWADAVTLAMTYAEIPYTPLYDKEILAGDLAKYDWVHLHHEDFTGQFSKFWVNYRNQSWFREGQLTAQQQAKQAGFPTVSEHKKAVAREIRKAVANGLFLFAMCTATETLDLALAAEGKDMVAPELDGTPVDVSSPEDLDYNKTMAFERFDISPSPYINNFSDIDFNQVNVPEKRKETTDFILFDFSAKIDPIPTLLNQNHVKRIDGFFGQTTTYVKSKIKDGVTILAESIDGSVRYLTGKYGKGNFTFYGGHEPEDRYHYVGDKSPDLESYKNSPGYRLILNNILFPSAKPPPKKT